MYQREYETHIVLIPYILRATRSSYPSSERAIAFLRKVLFTTRAGPAGSMSSSLHCVLGNYSRACAQFDDRVIIIF